MSALLTKIDEKHVATLTLNRPLIHNAIDDTLIMELTNALRDLESKPQVRAVVLTSSGSSFCAGADLHWMRRMAGFSAEENLRDAEALAGLLRRLSVLAKPTLAVVQGPAYGGGVGLIAACDIAVAADSAVFSLSEVRLGLIPATISPYVIGAIGARAARRYFLSGERFTAAEAHRLGLVHEVVAADQLQRAAERMLRALLEGGPRAQAEAKRLVADVTNKPLEPALLDDTAKRIAAARASAEGREGITAFLEKRKPNWVR